MSLYNIGQKTLTPRPKGEAPRPPAPAEPKPWWVLVGAGFVAGLAARWVERRFPGKR